MIEKTTYTKRTGRYFHNQINFETVDTVIFAIHGYACLARSFFKKLDFLAIKNNLLVCPEGLSKFYFKGFEGKVVASWMTSEDRKNEIKDYCVYLDKVYSTIINSTPNQKKIIVLGFSQGCATICRWLSNDYSEANEIILCSGDFPNDVNYKKSNNFQTAHLKYLYGTRDPFLDKQNLSDIRSRIKKNVINSVFHSFNDSHKINEELISDIIINS